MDMASKVWVIAWFVVLLFYSIRDYRPSDSVVAAVGAMLLLWSLVGWIPVAMWLFL